MQTGINNQKLKTFIIWADNQTTPEILLKTEIIQEQIDKLLAQIWWDVYVPYEPCKQ